MKSSSLFSQLYFVLRTTVQACIALGERFGLQFLSLSSEVF